MNLLNSCREGYKMKVLQINAKYGYSSTGLIVKDIEEAVIRSGGESYCAYQSCVDAPLNGYKVGNVLDYKLHAFFCRLTGKQAYFSKSATQKLIKYISSVNPDIVHLHNLHSNYIHLNRLLTYLAKRDIATVITLHDCWYFTGKCFHYADVGCERFQNECGACPKKKAPPQSFFLDCSRTVVKDRNRFLSKIPRVTLVGCSQWICNETRKSSLKDMFIKCIYNGVDVDIFKPYNNNELRERYGLNEECYIVMGMANKWLLSSNQTLLRDVTKILNGKLKLMIVGCNNAQIAYLQQLNTNIIPLGFIQDRKELAKHYSLSNVFVNVTHADTLPTVNMESICCGTPVITFDSCGSPELILEGCGTVVKENDFEEMLFAIKEEHPSIDENVLKSARKRFSKNECYKEYLELYNNIFNGENSKK